MQRTPKWYDNTLFVKLCQNMHTKRLAMVPATDAILMSEWNNSCCYNNIERRDCTHLN